MSQKDTTNYKLLKDSTSVSGQETINILVCIVYMCFTCGIKKEVEQGDLTWNVKLSRDELCCIEFSLFVQIRCFFRPKQWSATRFRLFAILHQRGKIVNMWSLLCKSLWTDCPRYLPLSVSLKPYALHRTSVRGTHTYKASPVLASVWNVSWAVMGEWCRALALLIPALYSSTICVCVFMYVQIWSYSSVFLTLSIPKK